MAFEGQEFVMLRIEIIGNLGSDPEQRYTAEGVAMSSIRVAVNSRRRGPDGDNVERTDWFRVRTMGSKADDVVNLSPREDGPRGQGESSASSASNGRPAEPTGARRSAADQDLDLEDLPF
jgi:hypothetical protein